MVIGLLTLEIYFPYSHSLKEKRKILKSFKDRIKNRYNISFAELDYQTKWQRTKIGLVTINSHRKPVESLLNRILYEAEKNIEGEIINSYISYF
ncbi:MAG: DUF503 domain-containing protein [Candidatus Aminicenantales bacterium]